MSDSFLMWFNFTAGVASLLGLLLSVWLWILTRGIRQQVRAYATFKRFEAAKKSIQVQLWANIDLLVKDQIRDRKLMAEVLALVGRLESYEEVFSRIDRKKIERLTTLLKKERVTPEDLNEITMILARLAGKFDVEGEYLGE